MKKIGPILLVDDDETNNFYVKHVLKKLGITDDIYVALNGQEALELLKELQEKGITIDLILLDINMPIMNGFEFLDLYDKLPNENRSKTIISMISSSVHSADLEKTKTYKSIDSHIEKPLNQEKMEYILSNFI